MSLLPYVRLTVHFISVLHIHLSALMMVNVRYITRVLVVWSAASRKDFNALHLCEEPNIPALVMKTLAILTS